MRRVPATPTLDWPKVFGDLSRDEILAAAKAAANGEPVQSRYKVGDADWISVTTTSGAAGNIPMTTVRCS